MSRFATANSCVESSQHADSTSSILKANIRQSADVVYQLDNPTPISHIEIPGCGLLHAKREDLSRVRSYKWRGAYFFMQQHLAAGNREPFVAASAGNHAQGVAVSAKMLDTHADIFMPVTTPKLKRQAVEHWGGANVTVHLVGDSYDQAAEAALAFQQTNPTRLVPAFDDLQIIAGQSSVALELFRDLPNLDRVYVPVGGGGLASAVAFVCKEVLNLQCQVIGVEVENQDCMRQSWVAGQRVELADVDSFCDGTAVAKPGRFTFELCRKYLDRIVCVSNAEVCAAIQAAWNAGRFLPEPSGAISLAGACRETSESADESAKRAVIITGCNMDFRTIPRIVRQNDQPAANRRYFRFTIAESAGALIRLLDKFMYDLNIVDFQYGKCDEKIARPVLGVEGPDAQLNELAKRTQEDGCQTLDASDHPMSQFRVIPFREEICSAVTFMQVDFPNRPGALRELMRRISPITNICFFDFVDTGESEGHGLIGFELLYESSKHQILAEMERLNLKFKMAD